MEEGVLITACLSDREELGSLVETESTGALLSIILLSRDTRLLLPRPPAEVDAQLASLLRSPPLPLRSASCALARASTACSPFPSPRTPSTLGLPPQLLFPRDLNCF